MADHMVPAPIKTKGVTVVTSRALCLLCGSTFSGYHACDPMLAVERERVKIRQERARADYILAIACAVHKALEHVAATDCAEADRLAPGTLRPGCTCASCVARSAVAAIDADPDVAKALAKMERLGGEL